MSRFLSTLALVASALVPSGSAVASDWGQIEVRNLPPAGATVRLDRADGTVLLRSCTTSTCVVAVPAGWWMVRAFEGTALIADSPHDLEVAPGAVTPCWVELLD